MYRIHPVLNLINTFHPIPHAQVTPQSPEFIPASSRLNAASSPSNNTSSSSNFQWPSSSSNGSSSSLGNNGHIVKPSFVNPLKGMSISGGSSNSSSSATSRRFTPGSHRNGSPESCLTDSPRLTPQSSPPTTTTTGSNNNNTTAQMLQENVGGTTYFYPAPGAGDSVGDHHHLHSHHHHHSGSVDQHHSHHQQQQQQMYQQMPVHMYPGPAAHVLDTQPRSQLFHAFFMGEELRADLQGRNAIANAVEAVPEHLELPLELENYHTLTPVEPMPVSLKMPVVATMYRATHSTTGVKYCLRRIHGFRLQSTKCMATIDSWKKLQHSNIVQLREVFTTKACGDNCE